MKYQLVGYGLGLMAFLLVWSLAYPVLDLVKNLTFLFLRPFSQIVEGKITKEFVVLTSATGYTGDAYPAWEVEYQVEAKKYVFIESSRAINGVHEEWDAEWITSDFQQYREEAPLIYFVPNSIPFKAKTTSTFGEVFNKEAVQQLKLLKTNEMAEPNIEVLFFKWYPSWPLVNFRKKGKGILLKALELEGLTSTGLIGFALILGIYYFVLAPEINTLGIFSSKVLTSLLILLGFTFVALRWPCPINRQWLDPTKRPRILIDSNFSENTRLWERN